MTQKHFTRYFAGPDSTIGSSADFEAIVRSAFSYTKKKQLVIKEDTNEVPLSAVCDVRYQQMLYALNYYSQVGQGAIKLPIPGEEHGYMLRDPELGPVRDNIERMNHSQTALEIEQVEEQSM